ncbi:MAG: glycosyltransferase [Clostridia bacterium]|nr:glycosyltransferase [Clostridia bacterium]
MKKICIVQTDFNVGGIQRSLFNLLRNLDYSKYEIDLLLFERGGFFEGALPEKLNVIYLEKPSKKFSFMSFDSVLKKYSPALPDKRYDLAIDFNSYQNTCAAITKKLDASVRVMWIHNDVKIKLKNEWKYRVLWHFFKGKFKIYDRFAAVSEGLVEPFCEISGVDGKKVCVIPNYVDSEEIVRMSSDEPENFKVDPECFNLVALGRLCRQKGFDILIKAFAEAYAERKDLRLYIIGDGEDRGDLEELAGRLRLKDKVFLVGNRKNPFSCMARCDAFVSSSRYEGQGLNILEAKVLGLPLIITSNLEKYTSCGVRGTDDLAGALKAAVKKNRSPDLLEEYDRRVLGAFDSLAGIGCDPA